ncbi:MAG TPA: hypothetical protein VGN08_03040 [Solirubrobacteraceae bacterium]|jgi:hypothetical protein
MKRSLKQKLLLGIAALVVLAGGTMAAVTAARGPSRPAHPGPLVSAAAYLGIEKTTLQTELRSGRSLAQIANSTSGKSAAGLVNALVAVDRARLRTAIESLPRRVEAQVNRPGGPKAAGPRGEQRLGAAGEPVTRYLGISRAQLHKELRAGRSLAQIADATPGKSAAGLIDALVVARKAALHARVAAGRLTPQQEQARLSKLQSRVTAAVNRARPRR